MKYRKRPLLVDAVQFQGRDGNEIHFSDYPTWFERAMDLGDLELEPMVVGVAPERVRMTTIHGDPAYAAPGDWIIPEPKPGRFYPIARDVFTATYELATEEN